MPACACAGNARFCGTLEISQAIPGLWLLRDIDLPLQPDLSHQWKRSPGSLLTLYARSLSRFHRAGSHWQATAVEPVHPHALGFLAVVYAAAILDGTLDNLITSDTYARPTHLMSLVGIKQEGAQWPLTLTTTPSEPASIPLPR